MPRVCTICPHPQRSAIDALLAARVKPLRAIARQFGVDRGALARHRDAHVPKFAAKAAEEIQLADARSLIENLQVDYDRCRRLSDACDEYLEDPERPGKYYLGPRGEDVMVLLEWETTDAKGKTVRHRRKELLHNLVQRIEDSTGETVVNTSWKHADPRKLIIEVKDSQQELVGVLTKILTEERERRQEHIGSHPLFLKYQAAVLSILADYTGALERLEAIARPIIAGAQRDLPLDGMEMSSRGVTPAVLGLIEQTLKEGQSS